MKTRYPASRQSAERARSAVDQIEMVGVADIAVIQIDDAVAVEKDRRS